MKYLIKYNEVLSKGGSIKLMDEIFGININKFTDDFLVFEDMEFDVYCGFYIAMSTENRRKYPKNYDFNNGKFGKKTHALLRVLQYDPRLYRLHNIDNKFYTYYFNQIDKIDQSDIKFKLITLTIMSTNPSVKSGEHSKYTDIVENLISELSSKYNLKVVPHFTVNTFDKIGNTSYTVKFII